MSKLNREEFKKFLYYIESMEFRNEGIWIPIHILERMYDDEKDGYISKYFDTPVTKRDKNILCQQLKFDK